MTTWGDLTIPKEETLEWRMGKRRIWAKREGKTILLATSMDKESDDAKEAVNDKMPDDLEWRRWLLKKSTTTLNFTPSMPTLNMIVRSKELRVLPGGQGHVFVSIPVWVKVSSGKNESDVLIHEPTEICTKTWFGNFSFGELCYGVGVPLLFDSPAEAPPAQHALCPVRVRNLAKTQLSFRRLCVRVNHLRVFQGKDRLWTSEVHLDFCGDEEPSRIINRPEAPSFDKSAKLLTESRTPANRSLLRKSFDNLMGFEGWVSTSL